MGAEKPIIAGCFFIVAIGLLAVTFFSVVPLFEFKLSHTVLSLLSLTGTIDLYFKKACVVADVAGVSVDSKCKDGMLYLCDEQQTYLHTSYYSLIGGGVCLIIALFTVCSGPSAARCFGSFGVIGCGISLGSLLYVIYNVTCDLVIIKVSYSDLGFTPKLGVFALGGAIVSAMIATCVASSAKGSAPPNTTTGPIPPGVIGPGLTINVVPNNNNNHNPNAYVSHSPQQHAINNNNNNNTAADINCDDYPAHNYTQYQRFDARTESMNSMS